MLTIIASMERELPSLTQGRGEDGDAEFGVLGIGPERASASMGELLSRQGQGASALCQAVLLVGFAGGADTALNTGDLVLASSYYWLPPGIDSRGAGPLESVEPDREMLALGSLAAARAGLKVNCGPSLTVDSMVHSPREKLLIYNAFSASSVNMEDYAAARVAADAGVPFLSARVVLDPQGQTLPDDLIELAGAGPVATISAAAKPWQFPVLLSLYTRMRRSQGVLTKFTNAFVSEFRAWEQKEYATSSGESLSGAIPASEILLRPGPEKR